MEKIENYEKLPGIRKEFLEGLREFQRHDYARARECFRKLDIKHIPDNDSHITLYLSYYGLTLILLQESKGLNLCRRAAHFIGHLDLINAYNPDIVYNLAVAEKNLGNRRRAIDAVRRGLSINDAHLGLIDLQREMGVRREPVFSSLPRDHFLNRMAGRWFPFKHGKNQIKS
jgi:tetratricopeptide (TPR) repeat protein